MSGSTTPYYSFNLPAIGGNQDTWGNLLNANWTAADSVIHGLASGFLPLSGGTLNGNLAIVPTSGYASLTLNKPTGANANQIEGATAGAARWVVLLGDATAESGGNAGSHFSINRFDDSGSYLGTPLSINRASGNVSVQQSFTAGGTVYSRGGQSFLGAAGVGVQLSFAPGWNLEWNATNGTLNYNCPTGSGWLFYVDASSNFNVLGNLACQSSGIRFPNVCPNGFNFRWDSSNFFMRVDNAVEIAVQPQSDERLKADIAPSTFDCLAAVLATPLFQFRWKNLGQHPNLETAPVARDAPLVPIGFVAQRQQAVFPASVIPGGETDRSAGGATTMWQMDHNALCAALCGAVQQLTERVADLEALRLEGQS